MRAQHKPIKLFCFDLNWSRFENPPGTVAPSAPEDWANIDPQAYVDFHLGLGNNAVFCQAYAFAGYAFYPTKLGAVAPGAGSQLLPRLFEITKRRGLPFMSYFCVGSDLMAGAARPHWLVPTPVGADVPMNIRFLAPETPWTDLLCDRVAEFLKDYPVDWLIFDWFVYGSLHPDDFPVQPAWFVAHPFREIIGREMPAKAGEISKEESLRYKREVLARQFYHIRDTVRRASPKTKIMFNIPYWKPREPVWVEHPMMLESDALFAESTRADVLDWLLSARRPEQRVMTTIMGRLEEGETDAASWRQWLDRGCDFFGYAWGQPPEMKPHPHYDRDLAIVRDAFHQMP